MNMNESRLQGKVIVVTGAGGRLGTRLVTQFTKVGAQVVALGNEGTEDHILDLTSEPEVIEVFKRIRRDHARIDGLVHAVGMWDEWSFLETRLEDWEQMMRVNLTSSFLCFREAVRHMFDSEGIIIGICARSGLETAVAKGGAYAASKAGLMRLIEAVAAEYPTIKTFALAPSIIRYRDPRAPGIYADDLVQLAIQLCSESAGALTGTALRAYGTV